MEGFRESSGGVPEGHARLEEGAIGEAKGDGVADQDTEGGRGVCVFDLVVALVGRAEAALDLGGRHGAADGLLAYHHLLLRRPVQRVRKPLRAQKKHNKALKIQPIPIHQFKQIAGKYQTGEQLTQGASHWSQVRSLPVSTSRK